MVSYLYGGQSTNFKILLAGILFNFLALAGIAVNRKEAPKNRTLT
jgi:hypothetical protein